MYISLQRVRNSGVSVGDANPLVVLAEDAVGDAVPGVFGVDDFDVEAGEELRVWLVGMVVRKRGLGGEMVMGLERDEEGEGKRAMEKQEPLSESTA